MSNLGVPFVFQFSDIVAGNGFFAHVVTSGCGLVRGTVDPRPDIARLKGRYHQTLFRIADTAPTFAVFQAEMVAEFVDAKADAGWHAALDRVRRDGVLPPPGATQTVVELPPTCIVTLIDKPEPRFNKLSEIAWAI